VKLLEMDRSRERSLCCEGGGGRMCWKAQTSRAVGASACSEAIDTGPRSWRRRPFCVLTLEDAVKTRPWRIASGSWQICGTSSSGNVARSRAMANSKHGIGVYVCGINIAHTVDVKALANMHLNCLT
jgi:hypothetical protein